MASRSRSDRDYYHSAPAPGARPSFGQVGARSAHAAWRRVVVGQVWPAVRSWASHNAHILSSAAARWIAAPLATQLQRTVVRPLRIVGAALLGMVYAVTLVTVVGTLLALALGLAKGFPPVPDVHDAVIASLSTLLPTIGWTVGYVALGLGAIVGASSAAANGGFFAGLEWAAVGSVGSALGLGVAYGSWFLVAVGAAWGGLLGGSIGLATWLYCTDRHTLTVGRRALTPYLIALVLVALYVPLASDGILAVPGG
jgi:hypothetical protein